MKLTPGSKHTVTDWYGMLAWNGTYVGQVRALPLQGRTLYLVERNPPKGGCYKYAGCEVRTHVKHDGEVEPYLFATHYGNTVEKLRPAAGQVLESWELVS